MDKNKNRDAATFGGGCFWCTEAVFEKLDGVYSVVSGYSGGHAENPSYEEVCSGTTGHAEVVRVEYDPGVITYRELLEVFFSVHDPTTLNRQGNDTGTQYRSEIFYHNDQQQQIAREFKQELQSSGKFSTPVVTGISPLKNFYEAEAYHQDYFEKKPNKAYCRMVIEPKLRKFENLFGTKLKE